MKFILLKSFGTSDDEDEEAVSEEEQQEESYESDDFEDNSESNEDDNGDNSDEFEKNVDTEGESAIPKSNEANLKKNATKVKVKPTETNSLENDSNTVTRIGNEGFLKKTNIKLDINKVKHEYMNQPKVDESKPLEIAISSTATTNVPTRLKSITTETMVIAAIKSLNERGGSSAIAIKKYIMNNYPQMDGPRMLMLIKKFIKKALVNGKLIQSKGTGLGGSFKVSPETGRLAERKAVEKRKKLMKKPKKDVVTDKADVNIKASAKTKEEKSEQSEKKTKTSKNAAKTKSKPPTVIKLDNGTVNTKVPKAFAALKKVDLKQPKKAAAKTGKAMPMVSPKSMDKPEITKQSKSTKAVASSVINVTAAVKQKKPPPTKAISVTEITKSPIKAAPKVKATQMSKNKPPTKGKASAAAESSEIGAGDANNVKPIKKTVGKKAKA